MGFLKVVLIIIVSFYALGFIGRVLFRYWIQKKQAEFEEQMSGSGFAGFGRRAAQGNKSQKGPDGEIKVQNLKDTRKKVRKDVGDYVDYEEIKD